MEGVVVELIYNLSVLVACSVLSNLIDTYIDRRKRRAQVIQGILFGLIAIIGMLNPFVLVKGLIFDGRTIVISLCALFFGPLSGGIAAGLAIIYRLSIGGSGVVMGVTTSLEAFLIGTIFNYFHTKSNRRELGIGKLYLMGVIVHTIMLTLILTLPKSLISITFKAVGLPVIIIYPIITVLIGIILLDQENSRRFLTALQESITLYRTTLYSIGDAVIVTDQERRILHMNPVAEELTGWSEKEAYQKKSNLVFKVINEFTRVPVEDPIQRVFEEGKVVGLANHTVLVGRDGREIPIADSGAPIRDADGEIVGAVLVFRDQSAERAKQRQTAESEAKYRGIFESTNDGICLHELVFDEKGEAVDYRLIAANQNFEAILNLKRTDVLDKLASEVYGITPPPYLDLYKEVALGGNPTSFETYYEPYKKHFIISVFSPQKNQFATVFKDITHAKRLELVQHIQYEIAHGGMLAQSLEEFYTIIQRELEHLIDTRNFYVAFYNAQTDTLSAIFERDEKDQIPEWPAAKSLTGLVIHQRQALLLTGNEIQDLINNGVIDLIGTLPAIWLGVPLFVRDKVIGAMVVQHYTDPKAFNHFAQELLETIASQVGLYLERQEFQNALQESNLMLRSVLDTIPVRVFWKDRQSRFLGCNLSFARDAGREKPEDLIGQDDYQMGWAEQAELYRQDDRQVIETGIPKLSFEEPQTTPTGDKIWLKTSKIPLRNIQGEIIGVLGTYENITQQKLAEEQLRYQASLLQQVSDAIIATDNDGLIRHWSPSAEQIYGWLAEEVIGQPFHEIIQPEYRYQSREEVFAQIEKQGSWSGEIIHHHKDGHELTVISTISIIRDLTGKKIGLVSVNHDITLSRRISEVLDLAVKSANIGLWEQDFRTGKIIRNTQWANMLGYTLDEIEPDIQAFTNLLHPADQEAFQALLVDLESGQKDEFRFEQRMRAKDGSWRWILNIGKVLERDADQKPIRASGVHLDITEMKQAEEQLRLSESRMRAIVEGTPYLFFYIQDENANTIYISPSIEQITGYTPDIFSKQRDWFITTNPINEYAKARTHAHLRGEVIPEPILLEIYHADGHPILLEIYENPIISDGKVIGLQGVAHDITERKYTAEALDLAVKSANIGLWEQDFITGKVRRNEQWAQMLGYSLSEIEANRQGFLNLIHPDDLQQALQAMEAHESGKTEYFRIEHRLRAKNGDWRWILNMGRITTRDATGKPIRASGVHLDVTDIKKATEALRESEARFRRLAENAEDLIYRYEFVPEPRFAYVSPAATKITGYTPEEHYADPQLGMKIVYPEDRPLLAAYFEGKGKFHELLTLRWIRKDGRIVWTEQKNTPIYDAQGNLIAIEGIARDVTERKRIEEILKLQEEQLRQSQKMEALGQLASGIAHDFNNILGIIMGNASLLRTGKLSPEKSRHSLEVIETTTQRGADLVKQLLTLARKSEPIVVPVNLNELTTEIVHLLSETFPKAIEIQNEIKLSLPFVLADPTQLHQVLMNICVNARDAMPKGGVLKIRAERIKGLTLRQIHPEAERAEYVVIHISDTGVGIPKENLPRIFDPFFTTKERGKGTGLGLATVHSIVCNHNGFIDVSSEVGVGTTFSVYLPTPDDEETKPVTERPKPTEKLAQGSETILLIEDEEAIVDLITALLEAQGYRVLVAGDGQTGVELYHQHQNEIALVLTDMGLPRLQGDEVMRRIREINPTAKVAIASGFLDPEMKEALFKAGLSEFIQKPYLPSELAKIVREILDRK